MKKIITIIAVTLVTSFTFAQEAETKIEEQASKLTAAVDVVYPYIWRGIKYNADKIAIQPYVNYAVSDVLSVGIWGTTNGSNDAESYNEFDWNVTLQLSPIVKILYSDYYFDGTINSENPRSSYFDYTASSAHSTDLSVLFDFSEVGVPIDFQWNTIVGGGDFVTDAYGNATRGYSSYAELGYTYSEEKSGIDFRAFAGAAVINDAAYYGTDFDGTARTGFINNGINLSKEIKITEKYSIPVFARYIYNDIGIGNKAGDANDHNFFALGATFTIK